MANCFAHCGIRKPAVDAPQITEEIVEPDADIIAELMDSSATLRLSYGYSNLLNYSGENTVTFCTDGG